LQEVYYRISMKKLQTILMTTLLSLSLHAKSTTETLGDVLAVAIPLTGYGATLYNHDSQGQKEFYYAYGTDMLITNALKYTVREKRPESDNRDSFPSGHTSSAFTGATFIHKKYGFNYAIVPYLGAIYTAYSRVHANKHYKRDVVVGALIGMGSAWYFTSPYKKVNIQPVVGADYKGVNVAYRW